MTRILTLLLLALSATPVAGLSEYRIGGVGNPWEAVADSASATAYRILDEDSLLVSEEAVGAATTGFAALRMIHVDEANVLRPRFVEPGINLALSEPTPAGIALPYTGGSVMPASECDRLVGEFREMAPMFDGNPSTAIFHPLSFSSITGLPTGWMGTSVIDFGAELPIRRIRFYPRLGREDDAAVIAALRASSPAASRHPEEAFSEYSFATNALSGYELRAGGDAVGITASGPCDRPPAGTSQPNRDWVRPRDPRLDLLASAAEVLAPVVDLEFPTRYVRYLSFQPLPSFGWEVAEFEVFGQGYVRETVLRSEILDFGRPVT